MSNWLFILLLRGFLIIHAYNNIQISMPLNKKRITGHSKRQYARISLKKRKMLVRMVEGQGLTIVASVKKIKIKLTTARLILQKYRKTGTFPMRKFKKMGKMLLDLPNEVKKEQSQLIIKQQHKDCSIIKEQFWSKVNDDSFTNKEGLSENPSYDVKRQE